MLIECPECQKKISDRAHHCVYCGFPLNEYLEEERMKSPEVAPYVCKINGKMRDVKWVLDVLNGYTKEELSIIKKAAGYAMSDDSDVRLSYTPKNEWEDTLDTERFELASDIRDQLDLVDERANRFIYEILDNNKEIPKEFNGQTFTEWWKEQEQLYEWEESNKIHCPYCHSTNVKKITFTHWAFGRQWHCNSCDSDF